MHVHSFAPQHLFTKCHFAPGPVQPNGKTGPHNAYYVIHAVMETARWAVRAQSCFLDGVLLFFCLHQFNVRVSER